MWIYIYIYMYVLNKPVPDQPAHFVAIDKRIVHGDKMFTRHNLLRIPQQIIHIRNSPSSAQYRQAIANTFDILFRSWKEEGTAGMVPNTLKLANFSCINLI